MCDNSIDLIGMGYTPEQIEKLEKMMCCMDDDAQDGEDNDVTVTQQHAARKTSSHYTL